MNRFFSFMLLLLIFVGGSGLILSFHLAQRHRAPGPLTKERLVVIPPGTGVDGIAEKLASVGALRRDGLIPDLLLFKAIGRLGGEVITLKAGEYLLPAQVSQRDLLEMLQKGMVYTRKITLAEGLTVAEILLQIRETEGLSGEITQRPPEGALLPETYHFQRGERRDALIRRMQRAMRETVLELWTQRDRTIPLKTSLEVVTLASIVEKETALARERTLIASVFYNRLARGIRLQSDPTVVYAATEGAGPLGRPIRQSDLQRKSPYNTYQNRGLPPGPIANPGLASLRAVLNPAVTPYLYFVADGTGGHVFAKTHAEHRRNVTKWRKIERERGKKTR